MIARGFKPIGWVAAVGTAALGCYMLSLRVASERADLTSLERRIVATRQQIRTLQTERGTRGRLQQLEQWNDEVLALAPPASNQYLAGQAQLARFSVAPATPLDAPGEVRMASAAAAAPAPAPAPAAAAPAPQHAVADPRSVAAPPPLARPMVQRASLTMTAAAPAPARPQTAMPPRPRTPTADMQAAPPVRTASATPPRAAAPTPRPRAAADDSRSRPAQGRPAALLDERTLREIGTAARAERGGGTRD
jgi:hypothetical protein